MSATGLGQQTELGQHRVVGEPGVLPQAARRLDPDLALADDEVRVAVERLNLDAASYRQLRDQHGDRAGCIRDAVCEIIAGRGKMHNPVTGSGGMLIGTVTEVGPRSPSGLQPGDRVGTLVSLTLTPLRITDGLQGWDGLSEQVPARGHAILFARSMAVRLPDDLPETLALAVLDVCGAGALTERVVRSCAADGVAPVVCVVGAAGKSGALAAASARRAGAERIIAVVRDEAEALACEAAGLADVVIATDARVPVTMSDDVIAAGGPADVTVVCVDAAGCEHGAILSTQTGGTVVYFSMATSFAAVALGAEGVAADVRLMIGSGFVPGHAEHALALVRDDPGVRALFDRRLDRSELVEIGGIR